MKMQVLKNIRFRQGTDQDKRVETGGFGLIIATHTHTHTHTHPHTPPASKALAAHSGALSAFLNGSVSCGRQGRFGVSAVF
jgi:hypothetical protein